MLAIKKKKPTFLVLGIIIIKEFEKTLFSNHKCFGDVKRIVLHCDVVVASECLFKTKERKEKLLKNDLNFANVKKLLV